MVLSTETTLFISKEELALGLTYMNITVPYWMDTTVRWATQVEKAFCLPEDEEMRIMVKMIKLYEIAVNRKVLNRRRTDPSNTICSSRYVLAQTKLSKGVTSQ